MLPWGMAKKKVKRYTDAEKKEILDFIESKGRGGQTAAVKKFKVTAATISSWRKQGGGSSGGKGSSKELRAVENLKSLLLEIEATKAKLAELQKKFRKAKGKL